MKQILIADDEPDVLNILEKKLKQLNYDVITINNGIEVIDVCKTCQPDLLILDIVMPGIDGYTIAGILRKEKNFKETPIIFITAQELEYSGIQKRLTQLGNTDFLSKPSPFDELLSKIKQKIG